MHFSIIYDDKDITFFAIIITFCNFFLAKCKLFPFFISLLRFLLILPCQTQQFGVIHKTPWVLAYLTEWLDALCAGLPYVKVDFRVLKVFNCHMGALPKVMLFAQPGIGSKRQCPVKDNKGELSLFCKRGTRCLHRRGIGNRLICFC